MEQNYGEPVYTIGIAANKVGVCISTLRIWERKKLIKPKRIGRNRFYSGYDLDRLEKIKEMLQTQHINIEGVRNILDTTRCWDVKNCPPKERKACSVYIKYGRS
ncbi:MAG: MerR family transcriptional regulator [Candidatus Omnitrophica bacterium]|nr:MerR family transcriptional regulator [Candidatus Omnitrophota bacterium]